MRFNVIDAIASALGLFLLIGLVSVAARFYEPDQHFWSTAIVGYLITVPLAIAAWTGKLSKSTSSENPSQLSWRAWLAIFVGGAVFSALCVAIDMALVHPGISSIFTIVAVAFAFVALPSALRAWFIERFS